MKLRPNILHSHSTPSTAFPCPHPYNSLQSPIGSLPSSIFPMLSTTISLSLQILLADPSVPHTCQTAPASDFCFPRFSHGWGPDLLGSFLNYYLLSETFIGPPNHSYLFSLYYLSLDTYHHPTYYLFHWSVLCLWSSSRMYVQEGRTLFIYPALMPEHSLAHNKYLLKKTNILHVIFKLS